MVTSATKEAMFVQGPGAVGATVGATAVGAAAEAVGVGGGGAGAAGVLVGGAAVGEGAVVAVEAAGVWQAEAKTMKIKLMNAIPFFISTPFT